MFKFKKKMFVIRYLIFLALNSLFLFSVASENSPKSYSSTIHYTNSVVAEDFKTELKKNGVPFKVFKDEKDKEYISWNPKYNAIAEKLKEKAIGTAPPNSRSKKVNGTYSMLVQDIKKSNIPYTIKKYWGEEYIIWEEEDANSVEELFNIRKREALKRREEILNRIEKDTVKFSNIPQWSVDANSETPLSMIDAISIAKNWAELKWPNSGGITIDSINLKRILKNGNKEWWSYYITVAPNSFTLNKSGYYGGEVVIRMDGMVYQYRADGTSKYEQIGSD